MPLALMTSLIALKIQKSRCAPTPTKRAFNPIALIRALSILVIGFNEGF